MAMGKTPSPSFLLASTTRGSEFFEQLQHQGTVSSSNSSSLESQELADSNSQAAHIKGPRLSIVQPLLLELQEGTNSKDATLEMLGNRRNSTGRLQMLEFFETEKSLFLQNNAVHKLIDSNILKEPELFEEFFKLTNQDQMNTLTNLEKLKNLYAHIKNEVTEELNILKLVNTEHSNRFTKLSILQEKNLELMKFVGERSNVVQESLGVIVTAMDGQFKLHSELHELAIQQHEGLRLKLLQIQEINAGIQRLIVS